MVLMRACKWMGVFLQQQGGEGERQKKKKRKLNMANKENTSKPPIGKSSPVMSFLGVSSVPLLETSSQSPDQSRASTYLTFAFLTHIPLFTFLTPNLTTLAMLRSLTRTALAARSRLATTVARPAAKVRCENNSGVKQGERR